MSQNRRIPFGYIMKNGEIKVNPTEIETVRQIFCEYLSGKSLLDISKLLNSGNVPYGNGSAWNRNMIKRILENEKYIGENGYPQIVERSVFESANSRKERCATNNNIAEPLLTVRKKCFCKECGEKLTRTGGNTRSEKWTCKNEACYGFEYRLTDNMLLSSIQTIFNTVIANPELVNVKEDLVQYKPNGIIRCLENEIAQIKDSPQLDYERAKQKIYELAEKKFECCITNEKARNTKVLLAMLSERTKTEEFDLGLFKSCVDRVCISHFCTIEVKFINGAVVQNLTERNNLKA